MDQARASTADAAPSRASIRPEVKKKKKKKGHLKLSHLVQLKHKAKQARTEYRHHTKAVSQLQAPSSRQRTQGNPLALPPLAMKVALSAASATARALARGVAHPDSPPREAAGFSTSSPASSGLASTAPSLSFVDDKTQQRENLARGIFRGLVPTRPVPRRVLGRITIALHELRAIALDSPEIVRLAAHHRHKEKEYRRVAIPIVVWATIGFEVHTVETERRRVGLAVVHFEQQRAIGETRDGSTVTSLREVVTRVAWSDSEEEQEKAPEETKKAAVPGTPPTPATTTIEPGFDVEFDVTDITGDIRIAFHARRFELPKEPHYWKRASTETRRAREAAEKVKERGLTVRIGAVIVPMAHLLCDDATNVLRRGGAVRPFAARGTATPRWYRLFPASAAHQLKFVRGSHEEGGGDGSGGGDTQVEAEAASKQAWWRMRAPRQYLSGGVYDTTKAELAVRQKVLERRCQSQSYAEMHAGSKMHGSKVNEHWEGTGFSEDAAEAKKRTVFDELALSAERELREMSPHFSRAAMCGDNCGLARITIALELRCSPLEAYFLNAPSVGSIHPPHDGEMSTVTYPLSELTARANMLVKNVKSTFPPAFLLQRCLAWHDGRSSAVAVLVWCYCNVLAHWTQGPMIVLLLFAWGMLEQRRAHVEVATHASHPEWGHRVDEERVPHGTAPVSVAVVLPTSAPAAVSASAAVALIAGPVSGASAAAAASPAAEDSELWEGPAPSSFTGLGTGDQTALTWPSDIVGSPTLLALRRDCDSMGLWMQHDVVSGGAVGALDKLTERVKALSKTTTGMAKQFGSKYAIYTKFTAMYGSYLQIAWHILCVCEGALASLLWHDPHVTSTVVVVIILIALVSWPLVFALHCALVILKWIFGLIYPAARLLIHLAGIFVFFIVPIQRALRSSLLARFGGNAIAKSVAAATGIQDAHYTYSAVEDESNDDDLESDNDEGDEDEDNMGRGSDQQRSCSSATAATKARSKETKHDGSPIVRITHPVVILSIAAIALPDLQQRVTPEQRKKRKQIAALGGDAAGVAASTDTFLVIRRAEESDDSDDGGGDGGGDVDASDGGRVNAGAAQERELLYEDEKARSNTVALTRARGVHGALLKCKRGSSSSSKKQRWQSRYFCIAEEYLVYYSNAKDAAAAGKVARGTFDLHGVPISHLTGLPAIEIEVAGTGAEFGAEGSSTGQQGCVLRIHFNAKTTSDKGGGRGAAGGGGMRALKKARQDDAAEDDASLKLKALSHADALMWRDALITVVRSLGESHGPPTRTRVKRGIGANLAMRVMGIGGGGGGGGGRTKKKKKGEHVHSVSHTLVGGKVLPMHQHKKVLSANWRGIVYRSEVANDDCNPTWATIALPIAATKRAAGGGEKGVGILHLDTKIYLEVWSSDPLLVFGDKIASHTTTLRRMIERASVSGEIDAVAALHRAGLDQMRSDWSPEARRVARVWADIDHDHSALGSIAEDGTDRPLGVHRGSQRTESNHYRRSHPTEAEIPLTILSVDHLSVDQISRNIASVSGSGADILGINLSQIHLNSTSAEEAARRRTRDHSRLVIKACALTPPTLPVGSMCDAGVGYFAIQFAAKSLPSTDGPFHKTDGYLKIDLEPKGAASVTVFATEAVSSFHPTWRSQRIPLRDLCWGDVDAQIRITVWDGNQFCADHFIGEVQFTGDGKPLTVRYLMEQASAHTVAQTAATLALILKNKGDAAVAGGSSPSKKARKKKTRGGADDEAKDNEVPLPSFAIVDPTQARYAESTGYFNSGTLELLQFEFISNVAAVVKQDRKEEAAKEKAGKEATKQGVGGGGGGVVSSSSSLHQACILDADQLSTAVARCSAAGGIDATSQHGILTVRIHGLRGLIKHTGFVKSSMSVGVLHPRTEAIVQLDVTHGLLQRNDRANHLYLGEAILDYRAQTPVFSFVRVEEQPEWRGADAEFKFIIHDSKRAQIRLTALHSPPLNLIEEAMHEEHDTVGFANVSVQAVAMGTHEFVKANDLSIMLNTWDVPPGSDACAQQRQKLNLDVSFEWNAKKSTSQAMSRKIRDGLLKIESDARTNALLNFARRFPDSLESEHRLIAAQQPILPDEVHEHIGSFVRTLHPDEVPAFDRIPSDLKFGKPEKGGW